MTIEPTPENPNAQNPNAQNPDGSPQTPKQLERSLDRLLSVQRPLVLAHVRGIRRRNPDASPERIIQILERHYLTAVTSGGAAVGASAVIPGVGVAASLALSGVETAGFLEASALFAQSVTEVHGIAVTDPDRARTLVMAMILGTAGADLVKQFAGQATGTGPARTAFWGELVTKNLPKAAMGQIADKVKHMFVRRFAVSQGASVLGRAIPFGIGAVIGGTGNHLLGRKVVSSARQAFGAAPVIFPIELEPRTKQPREPNAVREPGSRRFALSRRRSADVAAGSGTEATSPEDAPVEDAPSPTPAK